MGTGNRVLYADIDFDTQGNIVRHVAAQTESDPVLHYIVNKMLRGEPLSSSEQGYYDAMAPGIVKPDASSG
jgi:hypothetical protein